MLSVLIPVYQYEVRNLVEDLHAQCTEAGILFEIICMDDASGVKFHQANQHIEKLGHCRYIRRQQNQGRSVTRNALCREAQFEYLLFLDCDSALIHDNFIKNYLSILNKNKLISGGRVYDLQAPSDKAYLLHWNWGVKRELQDVKKRMKDPVNNFLSNNFIISKELMLKFPFDEKIKKYGYEDVYFAWQLEQQGIKILHVENPVIHKGLDRNRDLLRKLDEAGENIKMLFEASKTGSRPFIIQSRLIKVWLKLNKPLIGHLMMLLSFILRPVIRFFLIHIRPSLIMLDAYRLMGLFVSIKKV
jgi:glycosyltransferase involved in cell wall biosynthesis